MAEDPWAEFRVKPTEDDPWAEFRIKENPPKTQEASSPFGDFFKSIPRGVLSGAMGAASALGQTEAATRALTPQDLELASKVPGPEESTKLMEQNVTGQLHQPEGKAGQYGATIGSYLGNPASYAGPGGLIAKAITATTGAIGSEAAGQLAEGGKAEPWMRILGGLAGGAAPVGVTRFITQTPGRIPVAATAGETERSMLPETFKKIFKKDWDEAPAQLNSKGEYDPKAPPNPTKKNSDMLESDQAQAWKDNLHDARDLLAPGGWRNFIDPKTGKVDLDIARPHIVASGPTLPGSPPPSAPYSPTMTPGSITPDIAKPTHQIPTWLDSLITHAGPQSIGAGVGHFLGGGIEGSILGAILGEAAPLGAHLGGKSGAVNWWLRNQGLQRQPSVMTAADQVLINSLLQQENSNR